MWLGIREGGGVGGRGEEEGGGEGGQWITEGRERGEGRVIDQGGR